MFDTLITSTPTALEKAGVAPDQIEQSLRDIVQTVTDKGPGGHILTGPVAIVGAVPGDTLEIHIERITLAIPYAYNGFRYGAGLLTDDGQPVSDLYDLRHLYPQQNLQNSSSDKIFPQ